MYDLTSACNLSLTLGLLPLAVVGGTSPAGCQPVPEFRPAPLAPRDHYEPPSIRTVFGADGQVITLENYAVTVSLRIDREKHVCLTSLRTEAGVELLTQPSCGFRIVGTDGKIFKDGSKFRVETWHTWRPGTHVELELVLSEPGTLERAAWRLRLYRDRPYLEQRFEMPDLWRVRDRALTQELHTLSSLRPVMPVNVMKRGFKNGAANVNGRHRFEFVDKCEHLVYDPDLHSGLAGFVAGVGGEERMTAGEVAMLDYATPALGNEDPLARIVLFPFDGPVEKGFQLLRRFIGNEYACQGDRYSEYTWNQFWLWQGKHNDWGYQEVTADRLLDILPHLSAMGVEALHLDAGWEEGMNRGGRTEDIDWHFDPTRFPDGFEPIRRFLREHSMGYLTHLFQTVVNKPDVIIRLTWETDLDKLFIDRNADEKTLACMRQVRKVFPDFQVFCHSMNDARRANSYWSWGNIHYLSDFDQVYFGEGSWGAFASDLPQHVTIKRFIDLFTRSAAYQAAWVWPYKCIHPPHAGYTLGGDQWRKEPAWTRQDVASLILTTIAARYNYGWGDDPRLMKPEVLSFFLDWTAFWKVFRPYLQEYQHILPVPDGIHPDGVAHLKNGEGFIVLFNPSDRAAKVALKEILWEPELELDPRKPVELTDWTKPVDPKRMGSVDLAAPRGDLAIEPLWYRVIVVNLDMEDKLAEVKRQRSLLKALQ